MKTILYSLIAILFISTIASGYINKSITKKGILIQTTDNGVSSLSLSGSAKIISERLKDYSTEKFDINIIPGKNQIYVILSDNWNLKTAESLITQKGVLELYETYQRSSLSELLNGDKYLFSLLKSSKTNDSVVKIGRTSVEKSEIVDTYLNSLDLGQKCKFAWGQISENSEVNLYALKLNIGNGALLKGSDIETIKCEIDSISKKNYLELKFKESAKEIWADATKRNINRAIAIVMDNIVISAPIVQSEITNGKCQIAGNYNETEARYISALANNGELPVNFRIVK
jgi:preprotein translocase subunit SecD